MIVSLPLGMRRRRGSIPEGNVPASLYEVVCCFAALYASIRTQNLPRHRPSRMSRRLGRCLPEAFPLLVSPCSCPLRAARMLRYWVLIVEANQRTVGASQLVKLHDETAFLYGKIKSEVFHLPLFTCRHALRVVYIQRRGCRRRIMRGDNIERESRCFGCPSVP